MKMYEPHRSSENKIDPILERYFRAEMPQPWPGFAYPEENGLASPAPQRSRRRSWVSRLAVAACVALLFLGYLALARFFPADRPISAEGLPADRFGDRPVVKPLNPATAPDQPAPKPEIIKGR